MNNILKYVGLFIVLALFQILVLNQIFFQGYATPFIYVYFLIKLPISLNRNWVLLLGFLLGLTIDLFCNTPGINASATTFAAFLRYPTQKLFFDKEEFEHIEPKLSILGSAFIKYAIAVILIHHISLVCLEYFSYVNLGNILIRILTSSILTFIIIFAIEGFSIKKRR